MTPEDKAKRAAYDREKYLRTKPHRLEVAAAYREANRALLLAKEKERVAKRRVADPDYGKRRYAAWKEKHPEVGTRSRAQAAEAARRRQDKALEQENITVLAELFRQLPEYTDALKESRRDSQRRYYRAHPERVAKTTLRIKNKQCAELSDEYIRATLGLKKTNAPPELVELQRTNIKLKRYINEISRSIT